MFRQLRPTGASKGGIVIAWRSGPQLLTWTLTGGACTYSQLLLPSCCIQRTILPYTFLCFSDYISQLRLPPVLQTSSFGHSAVSAACHRFTHFLVS